jgi:SNF2 family DNA or RNA helicase
MDVGVIKRVLVVCPLSIMDSAWRADLFSFAMHRRVDIAYGAAPKRRKIISGNAEFVIINYDGIQIVEKEVAEGGFDLIIIDEANHYKNPQTKRWKCLNRLVTEDTWLWMMTGTPAAQSPTDAYGIAKLVNRGGVPRTGAMFRDMVMRQLTKFKWTPKETAVATVHEVLQPAIRYTKEECLDLPDMVYMKRHVDMTKQQTVYYERLRKDLVMEAAGEEVSAVNAAIMMNKLLQISAGAVYTDEKDTVEFDISNRYNVLREVIDESSHKTLVFVPFKSTIRMLAERLRDDGVTTEVISGDVSANARTEIFKRFQDTPDPQVLVVQPQAAAHGVTLTAANTVVWWAPTASLETFAQANARVHRAGQKNKCTVVQLSSSTAEKKLYAALTARDAIHREIVDLYKEMLD